MPTVRFGISVPLKWKILPLEEKWMTYLTTQYPIHENLIQVFFFNTSLEQAGEPDEDSCRIMAINTYVMGVSIRVTQEDVATTF